MEAEWFKERRFNQSVIIDNILRCEVDGAPKEAI